MAEGKTSNDAVDRYASGTGRTDAGPAENDIARPGVTGGTTYLPETGRARAEGTGADSAEGTIGAVGEMDFTGAPAGPSGAGSMSGGSGAGESQGGGPGGGAVSGGGIGPGAGDAGPQSIQSTVAFLGDRELSTSTVDAGRTGGMGGASGTGGAGGSDIAGDDAATDMTGGDHPAGAGGGD